MSALCWKCATEHPPPTGESCSGPVVPGRVHRSGSVTKKLDKGEEEMTAKADYVVVQDMDEEEEALVAELKEAERNQRKLQLRARIEALNKTNEDLGKGITQPTVSDPNMDLPKGIGIPPASTEKEKASKYEYTKYIPKDKDNRALSFEDFMYAALKWVIDNKDIDVVDMKNYLRHLSYLAHKAGPKVFVQEAVIDYDKAVRAKAEENGMKAFTAGDVELTLLYFGYENTVAGNSASKQSQKSGGTGTNGQGAKKQALRCHLFNFEESGCPKGGSCKFPHVCKKCGAKDHGFIKCKKSGEK